MHSPGEIDARIVAVSRQERVRCNVPKGTGAALTRLAKVEQEEWQANARDIDPVSLDIAHVRQQFPALQLTDGGRQRIYLDAPGGTQVPARVLDRMRDQLIRCNANCGGSFASSQAVDALSLEAHAAAADLLGAGSDAEIVFGQSMTALTFALSRSIGRKMGEGDEIIVTRMDHDGNVAPWLMMAEDRGVTVRWAEICPRTFALDLDQLRTLIGPRTRLAAIGHASNFTGAVNDIAAIAAMLKPVGAWLYVDGVQFVPHHKVDVLALGCDFYICSAYKFFGPHQAILWGRRDLLDGLTAYRVRPAGDALPGKFEVGTPSYEGQAGVLGAVEFISSLGANGLVPQAGSPRRAALRAGMDAIGAHEADLRRALVDGLSRIPGVTILGPAQAGGCVPVVSFLVAGRSSAELAAELAERNIFCWSGSFYAHELSRALDLPPDGALRLGLSAYNSMAEVRETLSALNAALDSRAPDRLATA